MHVYDNISMNSSYIKNISDKSRRENKITHFSLIIFFSRKILPFMR